MENSSPHLATISSRLHTVPRSALQRQIHQIKHTQFAERFGRRAGLIAALIALAVIGSTALMLAVDKNFTASADVALPMQTQYARGAHAPPQPLDTKALLNKAQAKMASAYLQASGSTLRASVKPGSDMVTLFATSNDSFTSAELANTAAQMAIERDRALWLDEVAHSSATNRPATTQTAYIVQQASSGGTSPASTPHYFIRAAGGVRQTLGILWSVLMVAGAGLSLLIGHQSGPVVPKVAENHWHKRAGKQNVSPTALAKLPPLPPTLAEIMLTPDLAANMPGAVRPVMVDVDVSLVQWLSGRATYSPTCTVWNETDGAAPTREFLITRTHYGDRGSRATSLALGRTLARRGVSAVIVDTDMIAGIAERAEFGLPDEVPGLSEILRRKNTITECILEDDDYPGLCAITSGWEGGMSDADATKLLSSADFLDLLDHLAGEYGVVLLHGPPADLAATTLGPRASATILVCRDSSTPDEQIANRAALALLQKANANVIGTMDISEATSRGMASERPTSASTERVKAGVG